MRPLVSIIIVSYNHIDGGDESGAGSNANFYGVIRILNGRTCEQLETIDDVNNRAIGASPPAIADLDGDGFDGIVDCDDDNANVNPGATEIAYNGLDDDCSNGDLVDVDGDGYDSSSIGGDDCNDDDATINPATQTFYDSGFSLPTLAAGNYVFTVATFNNFSNSLNLSDGFNFDSQTPIALSEWEQPANARNMGTSWSVWLDGVDDASGSPIPEPSTYALMLGGLGLVGFMAARRRARQTS